MADNHKQGDGPNHAGRRTDPLHPSADPRPPRVTPQPPVNHAKPSAGPAHPMTAKRNAAKTIGYESGIAGQFNYIDAPAGWDKDRRLTYLGVSLEHTGEDADGCWIYRQM